MEPTGTTWVVAADGAEARFFAEPRRAGPVHELADLHMRATAGDHAPSGQTATVHQRAGAGRHGAGEASPRRESEERFLRRVAERLDDAARRGAYDRLVMMAPPQALGVLRQALAAAATARLDGADPHERVRETAEDIRRRLRDVRARA